MSKVLSLENTLYPKNTPRPKNTSGTNRPLFRPDFNFGPTSTTLSDDETIGPLDTCQTSANSVPESTHETVDPPQMSLDESVTLYTEVNDSSVNDDRLGRIAGQSVIWQAIAGRSGRGSIKASSCRTMVSAIKDLYSPFGSKQIRKRNSFSFRPQNSALTQCGETELDDYLQDKTEMKRRKSVSRDIRRC